MSGTWCSGTDNVIAWFDEQVKPPYAYSLWGGKQLYVSNEGGSEAGSSEDLRRAVAALEGAGVTTLFTLKLHPKGENITDKSPYYGSLNFKPSAAGGVMAGTNGEVSFPNHAGMQTLLNKMNEISSTMESRLSALEAQDDPQGVTGMPAPMEMLGQLFNNPALQDAIANRLAGIINGIQIPGLPPPAPAAAPRPVRHLGNIPEQPAPPNDDLLNDALDILEQHDDQLAEDLMRLAELAQSDPVKFQLAINAIRSI